MSKNTYPRVQVTGAPGYEDFEGELILDSEHFAKSVVVAFMAEGAQDLATVPRECVTVLPEPQSGYTHCACRDCMDVAITSDGKPALCLLCKDAGCYMWPGEWGGVPLHGPRDAHGYECQRIDAYEEAQQCEGHYDDDDALTSGVGIGEAIYCDGSCVSRS